jgi:hypothetical protein
LSSAREKERKEGNRENGARDDGGGRRGMEWVGVCGGKVVWIIVYKRSKVL